MDDRTSARLCRASENETKAQLRESRSAFQKCTLIVTRKSTLVYYSIAIQQLTEHHSLSVQNRPHCRHRLTSASFHIVDSYDPSAFA